MHRVAGVAHGHDFTGVVGVAGPAAGDQLGGQRLFGDDEAVVAGGGERVGESGEDAHSVVMDL